MQVTLDKFKTDILENVTGIIAISITEVETGISYLTHSTDPNFDVEIAAPFNLEVLKSKIKATKALGIKENINDILISFDSQIHIIDLAEDASYFIYLAVDAKQNNLGMTRSVLKKYKKDIKGIF